MARFCLPGAHKTPPKSAKLELRKGIQITLDVPYLSIDELRSRAESFLNRYHSTRSLLIPIEEIIEFQLRLNIIPIEGMFTVYDVDAYITSATTVIYVDQYIYMHRQNRCRFSFAHEIGHAVLHQKIFRQLSFNSTEEWKRVQTEIDDSSYSRLEYQANAFAAFVLMPEDVLQDRFAVAVAQVDEKAGKNPQISSEFRRKLVIRMLSGEFAVSQDAMRIRLEKADLSW